MRRYFYGVNQIPHIEIRRRYHVLDGARHKFSLPGARGRYQLFEVVHGRLSIAAFCSARYSSAHSCFVLA